MGLIENTHNAEYYSISHGALRKRTTEDDPNAVKRTYEKDGVEKTTYEIVKKGVTGVINQVFIKDGDYGEQLYIHVIDVAEEFFVQIPWDSKYTRHFLEKLPNVDLSKEVAIIPYDFTKDGKRRVGLSLWKDYDTDVQESIKSYFVEFSEDGKFLGTKHGYPSGEKDMSKDEFKMIGLQQLVFLRKNVLNKFPDFGVFNGDVKTEDANKGNDLPF